MIKDLFLVVFLGGMLSLNAQNVLTLKPGPTDGIDAGVNSHSNNLTRNYATYGVSASYYWDNGNQVYLQSTYFKFDLSNLPPNAEIISARLDLVSDNPTTTFVGNPSTPNNGSENGAYVKRVLSTWDESTITWNNQPQVASIISDTMPPTVNDTSNFSVPLTNVIKEIHAAGVNHGFVVETSATQPNNSLVYRTSDYPTDEDWPVLYIFWDYPAGINTDNFSELKVSPNPFQNQLNFTANAKDDVLAELFDLNGRLLKSSSLFNRKDGSYSINNLELLSAGSYLLKVSSGTSVSTKLVSKH